MHNVKSIPPAQKALMKNLMAQLEDLTQQKATLETQHKAAVSQLLALQMQHNIDSLEGKAFVANVIRPVRLSVLPKKVAKILSYAEYVNVAKPTLAALKEVLTEDQMGTVTESEAGEPFLKLSKLGPREA